MCDSCGCNKTYNDDIKIIGYTKTSEGQVDTITHHHVNHHGHEHVEAHRHEHGHEHSHEHEHMHYHDDHDESAASEKIADGPRLISINEDILAENERLAERNRGFFTAKGILVLNILSSPGSGKTTLICKTISKLKNELKVAVIVGDLATDNDAQRLKAVCDRVVQINTGTACHLDSRMIASAIQRFDIDSTDVLIIENVGNLVCPAAYDLGENIRVVLLSVTEGEDKPLKYPPSFYSANATVISKIDLAQAVDFNKELALSNIRKVNPRGIIFEVSAKTEEGLPNWVKYIKDCYHDVKSKRNLLI